MKIDIRHWQSVLREADSATTRTSLSAAVKKFVRAKAELNRRQAQCPPNSVLNAGPPRTLAWVRPTSFSSNPRQLKGRADPAWAEWSRASSVFLGHVPGIA